MSVVLQVDGLKNHFPVKRGLLFARTLGVVKAVDGVSFRLERGDVLGLVGESGCGKSTLARSILRLIPPTEGTVILNGRNLTEMDAETLRLARPEAQMIFQDPYASLNPRMTVFDAIAEPMLTHGLATRKDVAGKVVELMEKVGLAARYVRKYPHEFSGGQRQRIAIARTLALKPGLIIADEPVSALDVSVQAQILNLIAKLCREEELTMIFISHDLAVVRHVAKTIAVMYLGRIVEIGPAADVFERPMHPYTQVLLAAVPLPDPKLERQRRDARVHVKGDPPSPLNPPSGCTFHPRCPIADTECALRVPPFVDRASTQRAACFKVAPDS
ncbi:MAG: oligopeptide/dipeptide ABC transporter ATP-binding protein [Candidatus Hydrogenedentota bacterium]